MEKLRSSYKLLACYLLSLFGMLLNCVPVYANQSNAVSDIMNHERFQGAIDSINWLTVRVDHWFTMVITGTAFFIISSAMLRNTIAGAYCANPKFWNKVAEAHQRSEAAKLSELFSKSYWSQKVGGLSTSSLSDMIYRLIPNFKALTDFDDADIAPKDYFMKAIPQMLACIIIGVFIYNGYYRDTSAVVGNFGSEVCNRFFGSIDAAAWVDKLTQTTSKPANIYDADPTLQGKAACEVSQGIYKTYISIAKNYSSSDQKASLMRDSEAIAMNKIMNADSVVSYFDANAKLDYSVSNLKIVPVSEAPQNAAVDGSPTVTPLSNEANNNKFAVTGYYNAPNSVTSSQSVTASANVFYISFQLVGSEKTNAAGLSGITAFEGKGGVGAVNLTVDVSGSRGDNPDYITVTVGDLHRAVDAKLRTELTTMLSSQKLALESFQKQTMGSFNNISTVGNMATNSETDVVKLSTKVANKSAGNMYTVTVKSTEEGSEGTTSQKSISVTITFNAKAR